MLRLVAVLTVFPFVALNASEIFKEMHLQISVYSFQFSGQRLLFVL